MTNRYYNKSSFPIAHSQVASAPAGQELTSIEAGFLAVQNEIDGAVIDAVSNVGFKNAFINGRMKIAQRATTKTGISSSGYYTCDMWAVAMSANTLVVTQSQVSDHPTLAAKGWSFAHQVTTAEAGIGAGDHCTVHQNIESSSYYELQGETVTLQFWVKSPKTGIHCVAFRNGGLDRSLVKEYTVSVADTWEKKIITVDLNSATGGWSVAGTSIGLTVLWTLFAGTTYQTAADVWQNGNFIATANQQNLCDTIGNVFALTDVQLERGSTATDIEARPFSLEMEQCERFYEKGYTYNVAPGTAYTGGLSPFQGSGQDGGPIVISHTFATRKLAVPTMTFYDNAGTAARLTKYDGGWSAGQTLGFAGTTDKGWSVGAAPGATATLLECQWTAEVTW